MTERCEVARCRAEAELSYLGHGICDRHWNQFTAEDVGPEALRMALGIEATAPAATEDRTMEPTTSKTQKTEVGEIPAPAKNPKPAKKAMAARELKTPKEPKPKKERAPKQPLVVFAFRLTAVERDKIHAAAGPGGATQLVRHTALAIATGDRAALEELLTTYKPTKK